MNEIVSRETMRRRGYAAAAAGRARDQHHMNPSSPAIGEWQQGWDYFHAQQVSSTPQIQRAPAARPCVDQKQGWR